MDSSSETNVIITHKTEVTDACSSTCWDFKCNKCIDQNVENGHLNSTESSHVRSIHLFIFFSNIL